MNIAIIGAGIIGLTSAYRIKESFPHACICVIAAKYSPHTTSDVSAGLWEPFALNIDKIDEQNRIL